MYNQISEEKYIVYKENSQKVVEKREFENFEDAYVFFRNNLDNYVVGYIEHTYKTSEKFYHFDKREQE